MKSESLFLKTIVNELDFLKNSYDSMKRQKKRSTIVCNYLRNAKEHYQSFLRKKNARSVKQAKIITQ